MTSSGSRMTGTPGPLPLVGVAVLVGGDLEVDGLLAQLCVGAEASRQARRWSANSPPSGT